MVSRAISLHLLFDIGIFRYRGYNLLFHYTVQNIAGSIVFCAPINKLCLPPELTAQHRRRGGIRSRGGTFPPFLGNRTKILVCVPWRACLVSSTRLNEMVHSEWRIIVILLTKGAKLFDINECLFEIG